MTNGRLENTFSWSFSRDASFQACKRMYFYERYGSWGGWEPQADPNVRDLYLLKNLKTRRNWKGGVVHDIIGEVLLDLFRWGREVSPERAMERLTAKMREDFRTSKEGKYRTNPKRVTGLLEHEYGVPVPEEEWKRIHEDALACVSHFFETPFWRHAKECGGKCILSVERLEDFSFEGTKVYVKMDLLMRGAGEELFIVDWKTGRMQDRDPLQLSLYAVFARGRYGEPLERIRCVEANLIRREYERAQVTEEMVAKTEAYMRESIAMMKGSLRDQERNMASIEDFPVAEAFDPCKDCNFLRACKKGQEFLWKGSPFP